MLLFGSLYHGHVSSLSHSGIRPTIPDLHRPNNDLRVGLLCQILRLSDFRFPLGIYRHPTARLLWLKFLKKGVAMAEIPTKGGHLVAT